MYTAKDEVVCLIEKVWWGVSFSLFVSFFVEILLYLYIHT